MFERRLKFFLGFLILVTALLIARSVQVQLVEKSYWTREASALTTRDRLVETTRGRILDVRGKVLAEDEACIDACVDYRAIIKEPDPQWLLEQARPRARARAGDQWKALSSAQKKRAVEDELNLVKLDLARMWEMLAGESKQSPEQMDELRDSIIQRVELRRRYVWWKRHQSAMRELAGREPPDWLHAWLTGDDNSGPKIDEFEIRIDEQEAPHVILRAIDVPLQNKLAKGLDNYPGLSLRPSTHRFYPYHNVACHVIGHLAKVQREDLDLDSDEQEETRKYLPNDMIGRDGLEALGEPTLRGTRGREIYGGEDRALMDTVAAIPGQDLHCTIDIELQQEIQSLFQQAKVPYDTDGRLFDEISMHGAAVVIDIPTGEVRALVSNPTFDLNELDERYGEFVRDAINAPLLHRATQATLEPGSTVKPMVGIGAITQGLLGLNEGIECTGYPVLGGRRQTFLRCWTASKFGNTELAAVAVHHQLPTQDPHRGHDGNPDGFLTFVDAVQRSCNVYFETVASRLGITGLSYWFDRFGLGRPTGIGIAECCGRIPSGYTGPRVDFTAWSAGIGQGYVAATPIQMCNVAATIARNGIWMRPTLVSAGTRTRLYRPRNAQDHESAWDDIPSRVDLKISPAAVAAAREGMIKVVNTLAGSGRLAARSDVLVAGKTGTAQASAFAINAVNDSGATAMVFLEPSTHDHPNPRAPWYRGFDSDGKNLKHSWFIGFAPADDPKIAFAVMVEYGGSGGAVAVPIARDVLEALAIRGYLPKRLAGTKEP